MALKENKSQRIVLSVIFVLFVLYAITLLYPMVWMFLSSLKGSLEYEAGNSLQLPKRWLFSNYALAFKSLSVEKTNFFGMVWNSIWMNGLSIIFGTFVTAITTYTIAKLKFPGQRIFYAVILFMMMLPIYGSMASGLRIKKQLGIYDSVWDILISCFSVGGYKFLILYSFFRSISWTYAEAAYIDGATHFQVFLRVMFPQAIAPLSVFAIQDFIGGWNDYMGPLIYMPSFPTIASGLYRYESMMIRGMNYPVYFAGIVISAIPILIIFISMRKTFMTSLSMGGLKG